MGLALAALLSPAAAGGHDLAFTETLLLLRSDGTYQVDMTCDLDALALGAGSGADSAELAAVLRAMSEAERQERIAALRAMFERRVRVLFDGEPDRPQVSFPDYGTPLADQAAVPTVLGLTARLEGRIPERAAAVSFRASRSFPPVHLSVLDQRSAAARQVLERGGESDPIPLEAPPGVTTRPELAGRYLAIGFWHIVPEGLDHILFVLGLFLLSPRLVPLLWQVSAFTAAHTLTLGLSSYGVVALSPAVVEPLIALSIAYVALENAATAELKPWRPLLVFAFGLLHGLGFAGVLGELGLPEGERVLALLAFNAGVELGQIAVIGGALLVLGPLRDRAWYRRRLSVPLSLLIAAVGLYWAAQRVLA